MHHNSQIYLPSFVRSCVRLYYRGLDILYIMLLHCSSKATNSNPIPRLSLVTDITPLAAIATILFADFIVMTDVLPNAFFNLHAQ